MKEEPLCAQVDGDIADSSARFVGKGLISTRQSSTLYCDHPSITLPSYSSAFPATTITYLAAQ